MESSKLLGAEGEEHQLWNNLYEIFRANVEPNRSDPLVIFHGKHVSYYSLLSMVDSMAESLKSRLNISKGDSVAICLPLSPQFFITFLALQKIGGVAIPLDPDIKTYELHNIMGLLKLKSVVCLNTTGLVIDQGQGIESVVLVRLQDFLPFEKSVAFTAKSLGKSASGISKELNVFRFTDLIYEAKGEGTFIDPEKDISVGFISASRSGDLQAMFFTASNLLESASSISKAMPQAKGRFKIASFLPPFLPASFQFTVTLPILLGGTVLTSVTREDYYMTFFTSSLYDCEYMLASPWDLSEILEERIPNMAIKSLKGIITETYLLNRRIRQEIEKRYGTRVLEYYGVPEMLGVTHMQLIDRAKQKPGSPGIPIPNVQAKLLEEKSHREASPPAIGELYLKGPGLFTSLVPLLPDNSQYFLDGYFDSGDLASIDEGGLYHIEGRVRKAITSHGIMVSSHEIEKVIEGVEGVKEVAVVGVTEETGNEYILAVVSSESEVDGLDSRIMQACRKSLSRFKVPRKIEFRKELPKSMSGKVLKMQIIDEHRRQEANPTAK